LTQPVQPPTGKPGTNEPPFYRIPHIQAEITNPDFARCLDTFGTKQKLVFSEDPPKFANSLLLLKQAP